MSNRNSNSFKLKNNVNGLLSSASVAAAAAEESGAPGLKNYGTAALLEQNEVPKNMSIEKKEYNKLKGNKTNATKNNLEKYYFRKLQYINEKFTEKKIKENISTFIEGIENPNQITFENFKKIDKEMKKKIFEENYRYLLKDPFGKTSVYLSDIKRGIELYGTFFGINDKYVNIQQPQHKLNYQKIFEEISNILGKKKINIITTFSEEEYVKILMYFFCTSNGENQNEHVGKATANISPGEGKSNLTNIAVEKLIRNYTKNKSISLELEKLIDYYENVIYIIKKSKSKYHRISDCLEAELPYIKSELVSKLV